jgi:hypothetical protein
MESDVHVLSMDALRFPRSCHSLEMSFSAGEPMAHIVVIDDQASMGPVLQQLLEGRDTVSHSLQMDGLASSSCVSSQRRCS